MTDVKSPIETSDYILHRALVLALLTARFSMEYAVRNRRGIINSQDIYITTQMAHVINSSQELRNALTPNEAKLVKVDLGEWPNELMIQMSWYSEECGCLLWCVGELEELPPFDKPFDFDDLDKYFKGIMGINWAMPFSKKHVIFRNQEEILVMKKRAELIFQRCLLANQARKRKRHISTLKSHNDLFHFSEFNLPVGPSGDVVLFDQEFCDFSEDEEHSIFLIAAARVHAFSWVTNPNQPWNEVNIDALYNLPE